MIDKIVELIHCTHSTDIPEETYIVNYGWFWKDNVLVQDLVRYTLCALCAKIVLIENVN